MIGSGWASRFLLNGKDVTIIDNDPDAERKARAVLANATRAMDELIPGFSKFQANNIGELKVVPVGELAQKALRECEFIQESLPENKSLKNVAYAYMEESCGSDVIIASSTSGIMPQELQENMKHPERVVVAHPFNPVYLLPLVEVLGSEITSKEACELSKRVFESVGMHALMLDVPIPGHVADRLLEALWREALHLVNEGVATTGQIDDAVRFGAGIRWSFMGTLMTYRLAGGEGGMRHFMHQFAPALKWPWTKLVAPEMSDELIEKIVSQTDAQVAEHSSELQDFRELEKKRDSCIVSVLHGLKKQNYGAGEVLRKYEEQMFNRSSVELPQSDLFQKHRAVVLPEWIDYNGHMTESRYLEVFGDATDALLADIGMDPIYVATEKKSYYTVETHIMNKQEVSVGELIHATTQVLKSDEKRMHIFHTLLHTISGDVLATAEQMLLHVDSNKGRACPNDNENAMSKLKALESAHALLEQPLEKGRFVGEPRRKLQ